jgi:hypothetical protein
VVTHTDAKELYVWDIEKQPNRAMAKVVITFTGALHKTVGLSGTHV